MNLSVAQGDIAAAEADLIVVNLFEGVTMPGGATGAVDRALNGAIARLIAPTVRNERYRQFARVELAGE